jgi:hypothetical protein
MKSGLLILAIFLGFSLSLSGQQHISFSYDNNGSRISRVLKVVLLKSGQLTFPVDLNELEEKQNANQGITVYPNPTTTKLMIKIDGYADIKSGNISIFSLNGLVLHRLENLSAENEIDLTSFEGGIYFIQITIGSEAYSYKIIKSK